MFLIKNINFSKFFLVIISIAYIVNVITNYTFVPMLSLQPKIILERLDLWKILTFPISIHTFDSFILFAFAFHFFSGKLENLVGSIRYSIWLLILNLILGCLVTLLFWNSSFSYSGLDSISFFVITLYLMLKPKSSINIYRKRIYVIPTTLLFLMLWIATKMIMYGLNDYSVALDTLTSFIYGVTSSLLVYFQIKIYTESKDSSINYIKDHRQLLDETNLEYLSTIKEKNASYLYNAEKLNQEYNTDYNESYDFTSQGISNDPQINEDRLNSILDKINDQGESSLTVSEKKFLYFYSKQL